ncbi:MAG: sigma-70 family RNA polymerase sigma factor [Gemmataceae bacterium]
MDQRKSPTRAGYHRPLMMAMVMGTALSGMAAGAATAGQAPDMTLRAVNDMSRYCTTCWRNARLQPDLWADCTQEVFGRLLERLPADHWNRVLQDEGEERREFLRAIDTVKKRTQRSKKFYSASLDDFADRRNLEAGQWNEERETVRKAAEEVLSTRQQQILKLSGEGWPVNAIAKQMGERVERVSDEKYKAIRKLRERVGA